MHFIFFLVALLFVSFFFAKTEIAVEGPHGWATNLPAWRLPKNHWVSKVFFAGKEATGYHVWLNLFVLSILHLPYLFITPSLAIEMQIISFLILFWIIEDFFWFVFNPHFGFKKFKREHIHWHEHWFLGMPIEYIIAAPVGIILYVLSTVVH